MKTYQLKHTFFKLNDKNRIMERESINIAMSFVTNSCSFKTEAAKDDKVKKFNVVYNGDRDNKGKDNEHILNLIMLASSSDTDILIFPEMLGNDEMLSVVREELEMPPEEGIVYPLITVLPTVWKDNTNCAYIVNQFGDVLFEQRKQISYKDDKENGIGKENIKPDNIINVLHCNHLGRIVVMICRDFLEVTHLQDIIYCVKPTLIIVPSYSIGDFDFEQVETMCRNADCCVAWVNSCAALKSQNQCVGFVDRAGYGNYPGCEQREEFRPCDEYSNKVCEGYCLKTSNINCAEMRF